MKIGITDTYNKKFDFYVSWLRKVAKQAEIVKLSYEKSSVKDLKKCDGLIMTGGGDIHPKFYGREDHLSSTREVNVKRDEFEFKIVKEALKQGLPYLGICRGMQVTNVVLEGSMIPDLTTEGYKDHGKTKEGKDRRHKVAIEKGTMLHWIVECTKSEINTAHHQAIDSPGAGLRVTAQSPDGVIEAMEWEQPDGKPFFQLVQWHPERMSDYNSPCSKNLLEHFVLAVVSTAEE